MSIAKDNPLLWTDINAMYETLRNIQEAHELDKTDLPSLQGTKASASTISDLNTAIYNTHQEAHLVDASYTTISSPTQGTLIEPSLITTIRTNINNMNDRCHHTVCQCECQCSCTNCVGYWSDCG